MIAGPALLFCPGNRPDRYAKAMSRADSVIIDLEDAVAPPDKPAARAALREHPLDPDRVIVRVNPISSGDLGADLEALAATQYRTLMLPKAEHPGHFDGLEEYTIIALCETPLGIRDADAIAADPRVAALTWGAEDLVAAIGGFQSRDASGRLSEIASYAKSRVLIAAAAAEKHAFDTVYPSLTDEVGLKSEATASAAAGFRGAMCLHPRQVAVIREAYRPSDQTVAWAEGVLAKTAGVGTGVFAYNGQMIDEPLLRQARRIVQAAGGEE